MTFLIDWIKNNKFQAVLISLLLIILVFMAVSEKGMLFESGRRFGEDFPARRADNSEVLTVIMFHNHHCGSCKKEIDFIEKKLKPKYPEVIFKYYAVNTPENKKKMLDFYEKNKISLDNFSTPTTVINDVYFIGFSPKIARQMDLTIKKNYLAGS